MALIKCSECSHEVSSKAKTCPNCGINIKQKTKLSTWILAPILVYGIYWIFTLQPAPQSTQAGNSSIPTENVTTEAETETAINEQTRQLIWIEKGKEMVLTRMRDPQSAEFQNVFFNQGSNDIPVTCGRVNGKNALGGYTGFQRFVSGGTAELTFLENEVADFGNVWRAMCK